MVGVVGSSPIEPTNEKRNFSPGWSFNPQEALERKGEIEWHRER
jgi:hypothetical protein